MSDRNRHSRGSDDWNFPSTSATPQRSRSESIQGTNPRYGFVTVPRSHRQTDSGAGPSTSRRSNRSYSPKARQLLKDNALNLRRSHETNPRKHDRRSQVFEIPKIAEKYKRMGSLENPRWYPMKRPIRRPKYLWPQKRRPLNQIKRSFSGRSGRRHSQLGRFPTHLNPFYDSPQWRRSRQLLNRSRYTLNRRPRDMYREKRLSRASEKRRQWRAMKDRMTPQRSQYLTQEYNSKRAKHMWKDRYQRAITGRSRSGRVSQRSLPQIVPTLPKHLETIPEEDEFQEEEY